MVRTKVVAILLGPSGVGLVGLYQSTLGMLGILAGLGINKSGVRQIAEATASGDQTRIGRSVRVLRRTCWLTGFLGILVTAALAWPLSVWTFGSTERAFAIAALGVTLLLGSVSGGQMALIQGSRRIGDLARFQVSSVAASTAISVGIYAWYGEQGIVPVLLVSALINLGFSWFFARRVEVHLEDLPWKDTFTEARGLIVLGVAFMWSGLLAAAVAFATRVMVVRGFGMDASGLYQAAWGISGLLTGFILSAMGTDFYPRLTAVAEDNPEMNRLVNEQTEVGILLTLSGLLGGLMFAPWVIRIFYSARFAESEELLPWFLVGVWGRVVSWPLGYIQLAKGAAHWFAVTETIVSVLQLALVWSGLQFFGLRGVAIAYAVLYALYILGMLCAANHLTRFRWSARVRKLLWISTAGIAGTFALKKLMPESLLLFVGSVLVLGSGLCCLRQICRRLGKEHRLSQAVSRLPVIGQCHVEAED